MILTIEDRPRHLLELLWIREAYRLHPVAGDDPPPPLEHTPKPAAQPLDDATRAAWESAWTRIWEQAVAHAGGEPDPALFDQAARPDLSTDQREALHRSIAGPSWGDEFGRDVFRDPSWVSWDSRHMEALLASLPRALRDTPERRVLDVLVPAWEAGLTKIVTIPCRGEYNQQVGRNALLVTDGMRAGDDSYRAALRSFR